MSEQDFSLEDIMKEFGTPTEEPAKSEETEVQEAPAEPLPQDSGNTAPAPEEITDEDIARWTEPAPEESVPEESSSVTDDTVRVSTLPQGSGYTGAAPLTEDEEEASFVPETSEKAEPFSDQWEPEYEQPMGEYKPRQIIYHPRSRLKELKQKLIEGPEKRYYQLMEQGVTKLQIAMFFSFLVLLLCSVTTGLYAMGVIRPERLKLMVFIQLFSMVFAALLGNGQLLDGLRDLKNKSFTLNTFLVFSFLVCAVDGVFCLIDRRISCCAVFSLEMIMSMWSTYHKRTLEMGQTDTMRKATRLDKVAAVENFYDEKPGLLRGEGMVEDFTEQYTAPIVTEGTLNRYSLISLLISAAIGIGAGVLKGLSGGIYAGISAFFSVWAVAMLIALPAGAFVSASRPFALLERRLHRNGTVLCGWNSVEALSRKTVFPLNHDDLFPEGSIQMNGVKFFGDRNPSQVVAYCTAVVTSSGNSLAPLFESVCESRNAPLLDAADLCRYECGAVSGVVDGENVAIGTLSMLRKLDVEIPEGLHVKCAVCVAIEGVLSGLFALTYEKTESVAAGLTTLLSYRGLNVVLTGNDFLLTHEFIEELFGVSAKQLILPEDTAELSADTLPAETPALLLHTREGLSAFAYGITGARALRSAAHKGAIVQIIGGAIGMGIIALLTGLGALQYVTASNVLMYQLAWLIPGFLITEWTRSV